MFFFLMFLFPFWNKFSDAIICDGMVDLSNRDAESSNGRALVADTVPQMRSDYSKTYVVVLMEMKEENRARETITNSVIAPS